MNERSSNPQGSEKGRLPLISVVMPCYNSENFLGEAIQSVINQTYKNWELFIIDDASTDHSAAVAKEYALHDARIHIQQNKKMLVRPGQEISVLTFAMEIMLLCLTVMTFGMRRCWSSRSGLLQKRKQTYCTAHIG